MGRKSLYESNITVNDFHIPYQDHAVVKLVIRFIKDYQPDVITINGDLMDWYGISKFAKSPLRYLSQAEINDLERRKKNVVSVASQRELNESFDTLVALRKACHDAKIEYVFGNHEYRLDTFIMNNAPSLFDLRKPSERNGPAVMSIDSLLDFHNLEITKHYSGLKESWFKYGGLYIGHFNLVRKHSSWTAKALVEDKNVCILQAHTHRGGSFYKSPLSTSLVGFENFCLCDLKPHYINNPNWQHGFSIVYKKRNGDRFDVHQIPIVDKTFIYEGKEYKA